MNYAYTCTECAAEVPVPTQKPVTDARCEPCRTGRRSCGECGRSIPAQFRFCKSCAAEPLLPTEAT